MGPAGGGRQAPGSRLGFDRSLLDDLAEFDDRPGSALRRLRFEHPEQRSPAVAEIYRTWYRRRGIPADRLLAECFLLVEPWWALRRSVPYWMAFATEQSRQHLSEHLDATGEPEEIRILLFSHGVESIGLAGIDEWRRVAARAGKVGSLVGVDESAFPAISPAWSGHIETCPGRMETVFEGPYILLTNEKITHVQTLMPVLEQVTRSGRPLVVVAEDVQGPPLGMLVTNNVHGTFKSVAVRSPGFGHRRLAQLEDIAALCGGRVVTRDAGLQLENVRLEHLGRCGKITVTAESTTIVGGAGDESSVVARIEQLKREFARAENEHDQDSLQERIARLSGSVAVLSVGAATGVELKEKQHRVEDSVSATRAAIEEGILPGGGTALVQAAREVDEAGLSGDVALGYEIVRRSLSEPLRWIAINAGYAAEEVLPRVAEGPAGHGFNALTGQYGDMTGFGVIDPLKVTRSALESAASIAALLLTTETLLVEEVVQNPGAIVSPEFGDLAEGMVRPSNIA